MSNLTLNKLTAANATTKLITLESGHSVYSPGSVVQCVHNNITTQSTVAIAGSSVNVGTDIPGYVLYITPKSANSKIFLTCRWVGEFGNNSTVWGTMFGFKRNGTVIGAQASSAAQSGLTSAGLNYYSSDANSTLEIAYMDYMDAPATTSPLTYQVYAVSDTSFTLYNNRTVAAPAVSYELGISTITAWEIAQ